MLEHGGRLRIAAQQYGIPQANWLDLSTGINPNGWPVPAIPADCWLRLPEQEDELLSVAREYYQNPSILAVAGSQAAIQTLPRLRPRSYVGVASPTYAEHAFSWQKHGHHVLALQTREIEAKLPELDVLVLVNPNNPTGYTFPLAQLQEWLQVLQRNKGWLIVDEAFIDSRPEYSLSNRPAEKGLIVLRSIGKFFGLAGIRCGFVISTEELLNRLNEELGPWSVSHPSRYIAAAALKDREWQQQTRTTLTIRRQRLQQMLSNCDLPPTGGCDLFQWIKTDKAEILHRSFAERGILTRLFKAPSSLRLGLPKNENQWRRLQKALDLTLDEDAN